MIGQSSAGQVDPSVSLKLLHASRGKRVRAEPVAAVFEQHRAYSAATSPTWSTSCCSWTPDDPQSPDRLDAMTWAMSELQENRRSHIAVVEGPVIHGPQEARACHPERLTATGKDARRREPLVLQHAKDKGGSY